MSHNLAVIGGKEAMAYVKNDVPWHGLGTPREKHMTSAEAIVAARQDWTVSKRQQFIEVDGQKINVPGSYAIVRDDINLPLGSVGPRYTPLQNVEAFEFMDGILGGEGGSYYETAGALGNGEIVWMLAKLSESFAVIPGDEVETYLMLHSPHDGSGSIWIYPTSVRVVCANTHRASLADRSKGYSISHMGDMEDKMAQVAEAIQLCKQDFEKFHKQAECMVATKTNPEPFANTVLDRLPSQFGVIDSVTAVKGKRAYCVAKGADTPELFETYGKQFDRKIRSRERILDKIKGRYESNTNTADGTLWAAFNAVTEWADHDMRYTGSEQKRAESRLVSALTGRSDIVKQTALQYALSLSC